MSVAALFTIARTWKQRRCPSTYEWMKKLWYIYNGILVRHKKDAFESFLMLWMYVERVIHREVRKRKKPNVVY